MTADAAAAADLVGDGAPAVAKIQEPAQGVPDYPETAATAPSSAYAFDPSDFDDVAALEFDVARVAGALGMEVDRSDAALMGRVALRVVDDPHYGAPPIATDASDPYLRSLERASPSAPIDVHDITADTSDLTPRRGLRLDYIAAVARPIAGQVDVELQPRANVLVGSDVSGVGGGAVVRLGRNLSAPPGEASRWYAFIGADAQALTWSLGGEGQERALRLEDKQMIGDYQAGVAVRVGGGDLAFGYVHREVKYKDWSREEQYAGVSFSIRR